MNVVVIHPSLNMAGGAERVCLSTIKALGKVGYKVKLVTIEETDWPLLEKVFGDFSKPEKEVSLMRRLSVKNELSKAFLGFYFILALLHCRLENKGDVIVNTYGNLVDAVADLSYVGGIPVRIIYRYPQSGYTDRLFWRVLSIIYDLDMRSLQKALGDNLLLANSRFIQGIIKRHLKRNSVVIYPPVDIDEFLQASELGMRCDIVVTPARFRKGKGLEIIPRIAKLVDRGRFVIIGVADQTSREVIAELTKTIETLGVDSRVELLVNQPRQKLLEILSSAKVYLHTQIMEAFGISVVEAMAAGCVPVVPRFGGPWNDILDRKQGVYGFSYSRLDEAATIIKMLLRDENLRRSTAFKAMQRTYNFSSRNFEKKILKIVEDVYKSKYSQG